MSDVAQLQAIGQELAAALSAAYGVTAPGAQLVFLPGGVAVPDDLVQAGMVNPTQVQTWLSMSFDDPFVLSGGTGGAVMQKDPSHGSASQIYALAVENARPLGDPADDAWQRMAGEIASAQRALGSTEVAKPIVCEPDDWMVDIKAGYWTNFDSVQSDTVTAPSGPTLPRVIPQFWMIRSLSEQPIHLEPPPQRIEAMPMRPMAMEAGPSRFQRFGGLALNVGASMLSRRLNIAPMQAAIAPAALSETAVAATPPLQIWRGTAVRTSMPTHLDSTLLFEHAQPVTQPTTGASTVTIHLEHQCVTLGRYIAGQPWWNSAFLAGGGWFIPGIMRGGLLPAPPPLDASSPDGQGVTYGLPMALVVVRNLRLSGQWSGAAAAALGSPGGTLGPLSLFGAVPTTQSDGVTVTYAHEGMQVVALLCAALPVLPPVDPPPPAPPPAPPAPPSPPTPDPAPASSASSASTSPDSSSSDTPGSDSSSSSSGSSDSSSSDPVSSDSSSDASASDAVSAEAASSESGSTDAGHA